MSESQSSNESPSDSSTEPTESWGQIFKLAFSKSGNEQLPEASNHAKLWVQILRFVIVGGLAFIIDFGILNVEVGLLHWNATLSATISFTISLIFNYWASMAYVFQRRDDMARWMEVLIFVVSSVIGLGINDLIMWFGTEVLLPVNSLQTAHLRYVIYSDVAKLIATVVVMIWNFIIRKWLLDAPAEGKEPGRAAKYLGELSLRKQK